jgi:hypothetical protein
MAPLYFAEVWWWMAGIDLNKAVSAADATRVFLLTSGFKKPGSYLAVIKPLTVVLVINSNMEP